MKIRSNPHTHSNYVDGKNTLREMAEAALALGFNALGFSEHATQSVDGRYGLPEDRQQAYRDEVNGLKKEYAGKMRIWLALERDRMAITNKEDYEYTLAANHYVIAENGDVAGVDDVTLIEKWVDTNMNGDWMKTCKMYFEQYADYVVAIQPDIIAHLDLIAKGNRKNHWFDESSEEYLDYAKRAMDKMITACKVMEVNTGGIARSNQPCPYPIMPLLRYWHDLGGEVIPSSDCHRAHQLGSWFDECPDYLKQAGYDHMLTLGTGDTLFETVPLE